MSTDDLQDPEANLDEDLFDFPVIEMETDEAPVAAEEPQVDETYPDEVVAAAAAVQDELDAAPEDDEDIFAMSAVDLGDDLDLDSLLDDADLLNDVAEISELDAPAAEAELEPEEDEEEDSSIDQLLPDLDDLDDLEDDLDELAAEIAPPPKPEPAPVAQAPEPVLAGAPGVATFSARGAWRLVAAILSFNLVVVVLGLFAISTVSSGVESVSSSLGRFATELRQANELQAREAERAAVEPLPVAPPVEELVESTPRVELPPFALGEIKAAREEMDRGEFQAARRRLFRLLATIDDPLAEDAPEAEEQANLLIAETYLLEADALEGDEG